MFPLRIRQINTCKLTLHLKMSTWSSSEIVTDKKSKFQGHSMAITSPQEINDKLTDLINSNKSIQKSSHPTMYAYRIGKTLPSGEVVQTDQGLRDCGEAGAGTRLMTLLERSKLVNVLVVVTRWYGGTPLGSARFRHISTVAVEALKKGGFYEDHSASSKKKLKSKKK